MAPRPTGSASLPAAPALPAADRPGVLGLCAVLFKWRIGFAIALSALAGMVVAAGHWAGGADMLLLALAVLVSASGAGAFNHYYDRDIDARMGRTRRRPFVSGRLSDSPAWPVLFMALVAAGGALAGWRFGALTGSLVLAGALTYTVVYTVWLKRRTHWNIVIGGAAGSFAVLAGAAAAGASFDPAVWLLALVLLLWTPSHFWSLAIAISEQYRAAGVPMLPVTRGRGAAIGWTLANTAALVAASLALAWTVGGVVLWAGALAGSGWLAWKTLQMARDPHPPAAYSAFKASLVQLGALLIGLFAAHVGP